MRVVKSRCGVEEKTPYFSAVLSWWASFAPFKSVLLGTHPDHVHSPPSFSASTSAVLAPNNAEIVEALSPAGPPPMTIKSKSHFIVRMYKQRATAFRRRAKHIMSLRSKSRSLASHLNADSPCLSRSSADNVIHPSPTQSRRAARRPSTPESLPASFERVGHGSGETRPRDRHKRNRAHDSTPRDRKST